MDFVNDAVRRDLVAYENDDFNLSYSVSTVNENTGVEEDYDFTSHVLHLVIWTEDQGQIAAYHSNGDDPKIVAVDSIFHLTGESLPSGQFRYALYAIDDTGEEFTIMEGKLTVKKRRRTT